MNRKKFIKSIFLTGLVGSVAPQVLSVSNKEANSSTYDKLMQQVGTIIYLTKI